MATRLGECLLKAGVISEAQLAEALEIQEERQGFLGHILLEKGWITDKQLCGAISESLHVNCVSIENVLISEEVVGLISNSLAVTCQILPLFVHNNMIYLAMENPCDTGVIQLVEYETGRQVRPLMAPPNELSVMIAKYYHIDENAAVKPTTAAYPKDLQKKITREIGFGERRRLGDLLVEAGLISAEQLQQALVLQEAKAGFLGELIVDLGWVSEAELCRSLSEMLGIEHVNLKEIEIHPEVIQLVSDSLAVSCNIFPFSVKDNILYLAMENPLDSGVILLLQHETGLTVKPVVAAPSQLRAMINRFYPLKRQTRGSRAAHTS